MKVVEIKKTALEVTQEDWNRLGSLLSDFSNICENSCCQNCPMRIFCKEYNPPARYLSKLYHFLDENS